MTIEIKTNPNGSKTFTVDLGDMPPEKVKQHLDEVEKKNQDRAEELSDEEMEFL